MSGFEDGPPNTPPPGPGVELPSIPPPAPVPGDFAAALDAAPPTEHAPRELTLSPEDIAAIRFIVADAVHQEFELRNGIIADALRAVHLEMKAESRDTLAELAPIRRQLAALPAIQTQLNLIQGMLDSNLQLSTIVRESVAPHVERKTGELSPGAARALEELRASVDLPDEEEHRPDEQEERKTER